MLKLRLITAGVLLLMVMVAVIAPSHWPMLVLLCAMVACACWEWLRLVAWPPAAALMVGAATLASTLYLSTVLLAQPLWLHTVFEALILPGAALFWLFLAPRILWRGQLGAYWNRPALGSLGLWLLLATWYALAWLFVQHGAGALISLWALVWVADSAAYFTGRRFGRHKLAPHISPGKTREGALGGVLAGTLWLVATAHWWPGSFGALLQLKLGGLSVFVAGVLLSCWSILGDLFESLLKRRAGVKDSSHLLPGHGGVYDRIDAVLPVAPLAVWALSFG